MNVQQGKLIRERATANLDRALRALTYVYIYIYIYILLELEEKFKERLTLGGAVIIMINGSKISVHRFIATTLFRMIEG